MAKIKTVNYFKDLLKTEDAIGQIEDSSVAGYLLSFFSDIQFFGKEYRKQLKDIGIKFVKIKEENGDGYDETFTTITIQDIKTSKFYSFDIHDDGSISTDAVSVDEFLTEVKPKTKKETVYE